MIEIHGAAAATYPYWLWINMTKSSSLDGPVMKLIEEFVKVESIEMEKQCQNLSYPTRFPWTSCNVVLIILSTKSIHFHQSWCTISVFGHVQEISVNTDWNFVFSVLRLWKMDENDPVPVSISQSTINKFFLFLLLWVFFCYLCQIYGYLAFLLPPQRGAHLTVVDQ